MTRLKYYLPLGLLTLALMLALLAGFGLSAMHDFSSELVGNLFAVDYRIEPRGDFAKSTALPAVTGARISQNQITISPLATGFASVSVNLTDANLFAVDQAAVRENHLRAGLLTLLLFCLTILGCAILVATAIAMLEQNRRATAQRGQKRRKTGTTPRRPLPPSDPEHLPRAA